MQGESVTILLVEDDLAHAEIVKRNFEVLRVANSLYHVTDGQSALDYLYRRHAFSTPGAAPRPGLILLDMRLPKVNGLQVLKTIKEDPSMKSIPVVILSTSASETDISMAFAHHANSYLVKPLDFGKFGDLLDMLGYYWMVWNRCPAG